MVWQPTGSGGTQSSQETRCGTVRATMGTNPLLARPELGKVKPLLFNNPEPDHVFGYTLPKDAENAREVTSMWKEHRPSSGPSGDQPDFRAMNITAAKSGVHTARDQPPFRASHTVSVKKFEPTPKGPPPLPSATDAMHTYGRPSAYRPAETVRQCGPMEPPVKHLVQGAYSEDWVKNNASKDNKAAQSAYIPPVPTRAAIGHAIGAQRYLQPHNAEQEWKMSKFTKVEPRVVAHMGGPTLSGSRRPASTSGDVDYTNHAGAEHE